MKVIILLLTLSTVLFLHSCESEYAIQLSKAKELVEQEQKILHSVTDGTADETVRRRALASLREDIAFHAHLSGNEEVFTQELNGYRAQLQHSEPAGQILISKYP
jgi:hypothetical protein